MNNVVYEVSNLEVEKYSKIASSILSYYSISNLFVQKSYSINIKFLLHKQSTTTLLMFCLLNPQTNAFEPNPKTTSSDFNR